MQGAILPAVSPGQRELEAFGFSESDEAPLFHVVLLDDDEHTYDYVVEMLRQLFFLSTELAFQHAVEVDMTGRTIVLTCDLPAAEFARSQIQAYGADPRMPKSKGSMSAVLEPAHTSTAR